jgi:adenosine deaminase
MRPRSQLLFCCVFALVAATAATAQTAAPETRAARAYQAAQQGGPLTLRIFLAQFPKGADLHVHLTGAVYAESFIRQAGEDGLCVDPAALAFANPPCSAPLVPAAGLVLANAQLYNRLIDAFSMRGFVPTPGLTGHDQFFATFARFDGVSKKYLGEWVDEVAARAAQQNQQYLELMQTPPFQHAAEMARQNALDPLHPDFAQYRQTLLALYMKDEIFLDREFVRAAEAQRRDLEHCATPQAAPACQVQTRYIYQILRGNSPEQVFAQTLLGFEVVQQTLEAHEPGFVGINFVMPEDGYLSMRDYTLQMHMLDYLYSVYPQVPISLHAGELAPGLVPPEGIRFHIRQAVELGHAARIGHGVDIAYEDDAAGLLKQMAQKHIMVEINLSSNEGILGVKGAQHPFPLYRAYRVPVALSTDDEGVSRIDLTGEYVRAALDYRLSYADLKQLARTGLEHSFLAGPSLWESPDAFTAPAPACHAQPLGGNKPTETCKSYLAGSEKAQAQWELERRFHAFDAAY